MIAKVTSLHGDHTYLWLFAVFTAHLEHCLQLLLALDESYWRDLQRRRARFLLNRLRGRRRLRARQGQIIVTHLSAAMAMGSLRDRWIGKFDQ